MQNSVDILNFHHEKENASLKVLVVYDKSKINEERLNSYYLKATDYNIYSDDLEFIDQKDFLEKYHSKEDFKRSLVYSDIILLTFCIDDFEGTFIEEYMDFLDYYEEYPTLLYYDLGMMKNLYKNGVSAPMFGRILSFTNLAKERNIEDVRESKSFLHTNGEREPFELDYSSIDQSLPYHVRQDLEDEIYEKECNKEERRAKKLLVAALTKDEWETKLLGIYDVKEIESVRAFTRSLHVTNTQSGFPYFCVFIIWVDKKGDELPILRETPWAINHFVDVTPGEFSVKDKVKIQKSLGNIQ